MPLHSGPPGSKAFGENIATEIAAGKPRKQAIAIAYAKAGEKDSNDKIGVYLDAVRRGDAASMRDHFKRRQ